MLVLVVLRAACARARRAQSSLCSCSSCSEQLVLVLVVLRAACSLVVSPCSCTSVSRRLLFAFKSCSSNLIFKSCASNLRFHLIVSHSTCSAIVHRIDVLDFALKFGRSGLLLLLSSALSKKHVWTHTSAFSIPTMVSHSDTVLPHRFDSL